MALTNLTTIGTGVAALATAAVLAACGADTPTPAAAEAPTTSAPSASKSASPEPSASETTTPLEGSWVSHRTKQQIVAQLKAAGLGRWTEDFLLGEEILDENTMVYTFEGGLFSVAYFIPGGPWHIGWKGTVKALPGHRIEMYDELSYITDTFRWRIEQDRLALDWVRSDAETIDGIPLNVYYAAYTGYWWDRTNCPLESGVDC